MINNVVERPKSRDYYTKTESERALIEIDRDIKAAELRMVAVVEHLHGMFCNMDFSLWPKDMERNFRMAIETLGKMARSSKGH